MTKEEKVQREQEKVDKALKRLKQAQQEASQEKREKESSRKFFIGGTFAKYLKEGAGIYFLDISKEETARIVAYAMKSKDTINFINRVIAERNTAKTESEIDENAINAELDKTTDSFNQSSIKPLSRC